MRALIGTIIVTGAAALALNVGAAHAKPYMTVPCYGAGGHWTGDGAVLVTKPKECAFNGDDAHAWQINLRKMRWRSWGGKIACGTGEHYYNMGFRIKAKFCLYGRNWWESNTYTYTHIRGYIYGRWHAMGPYGPETGVYKHRRYWRNTTW